MTTLASSGEFLLSSSGEFMNLPSCSIENNRDLFTASLSPNNAHKNRYTDILPFEHSLVKINNDEYINANYIHYGDRKVICCQAPLHNTIDDFWTMVWEQNSRLIFMLTDIVEDGKIKSVVYWPNKSAVYDNINITLIDAHVVNDIVTRKLLLEKDGEKREVSHVQYLGWVDNNKPIDERSLITLLDLLWNEESIPILHCSAGVGRTGTLLAIFFAIMEENLCIYEIVSAMRKQRMKMVVNANQYKYIKQFVLNLYRGRV